MPQSISQNKNNSHITSVPTAASTGVGTSSLTSSDRLGIAAVDDRVAIYKAAKAVHRSPAYVMQFVEAGLLKAYRRGGPIDRPWLAVDLSELLAVIDQETLYVPPALVGRRTSQPRINQKSLHPLAAGM